MAHLNKRKKAMRDWLRKWGKELKKHGYQVHVTHDELLPQFLIEEIQPNDDDDAAAQLEKEKYKKFFDPKSARSKRLGKKPEE